MMIQDNFNLQTVVSLSFILVFLIEDNELTSEKMEIGIAVSWILLTSLSDLEKSILSKCIFGNVQCINYLIIILKLSFRVKFN